MASILQDCNILVTRPIAQAQGLRTGIVKLGGNPHCLPTLEITAASLAKKPNLQTYDIAIFISPNAVQFGLAHFPAAAWPHRLKIAAIGPGTAASLKQQGLAVDYYPVTDFTSEGLLALPALQNLSEHRIIIFCGNQGRELLSQTLQQRGALVEKAVVYQRSAPFNLAQQLNSLWQTTAIDIIIATSYIGLTNLWQAASKVNINLTTIPLLVISERLQSLAQAHAIHSIVLANNASDAAICAALTLWKQNYDRKYNGT